MKMKYLASLLAVVAALGVAACGSSNSSGSQTSSSGSSQAGQSAANGASGLKTLVAQEEATPTNVGDPGALTKRPPTGKTIAVLQCPIQTCTIGVTAWSQAAKALGWHVRAIPFQETPQSVLTALDQAVASHPDGVVTSGYPRALIQAGLAKLQAAHIPVVDLATCNAAQAPIIAVVDGCSSGPPRYGAIQADYIAATSGGKANVVMYNTPDYPYQVALQSALKGELAKQCSGCSFRGVNIALTDLGPKFPGVVVSDLQRNPQANYVVLGFADMYDLGLGPALSNAGLTSKVTIVSSSPTQLGFSHIKSGAIAAAAAQDNLQDAWCEADSFARYFAGDKVPPTSCTPPTQLLTKGSVNTSWTTWPGVPGWQQTFLKDWRVS